MRVFPLSNWTELDVWTYIYLEDIPVVRLYFAKKRPVVERDGTLIMVDDDRLPLDDHVEKTLAAANIVRLGEMKSDVIAAVGDRMADLDVTFAILVVERRVLGALDDFHLTHGSAPYRSLGFVSGPIYANIGRTADVDCPHRVGVRL